MNYLQMKTETALLLDNMQSADPYFSLIGSFVNRSMNRCLQLAIGGNRANLSLFPRMKTTWRDTTVNSQQYIAYPSDAIVIDAVHSWDKLTADPEIDQTYPCTNLDYEVFSMLKKDATVADFPRSYSTRGKRVYFHPTPVTAFLTDVRFFGIMKEAALVNDSDTPFSEDDFHDIYVLYAAYLGARALGYHEKAGNFRTDALDEIERYTDKGGLDLMGQQHVSEVDGFPSRGDIY